MYPSHSQQYARRFTDANEAFCSSNAMNAMTSPRISIGPSSVVGKSIHDFSNIKRNSTNELQQQRPKMNTLTANTLLAKSKADIATIVAQGSTEKALGAPVLPPTPLRHDSNDAPIRISNNGTRQQTIESANTSLDSLLHLLNETCVRSTFADKRMGDHGKFLKTLGDIKQGFTSRMADIQSLRNNVSEHDEALARLNSLLFTLFRTCWNLNNKLVKVDASHTKMLLQRKKLSAITQELNECWTNVMLQIAMMMMSSTSKTAQEATVHVAQLAIATGSPDWKDLSLDDAAIFYLQGDKYLFGFGLNQSYEMAFKRYLVAAESGLAEAANMLGLMHENGLGRPKDLNSALQWYRIAEAKDCYDACNNLGRIYQNGVGTEVDYRLAQSFYSKAAQKGHLDAMVNLGYLLEQGFGSDPNPAMAFHWYETAANRDFAKAMNALGSCFYKGVSGYIDRSPETAVQWFRKSAQHGNQHALNNLGICYEEGLGVCKDFGLAKQYYKEAAALNHPNATNNYGYMLLLEHRYDEAIRNFHLALALGSSDAAYNLGTLYETGCTHLNELLIPQHYEMAIKYYIIAANQDHAQAQLRLGTIFLTGPPHIASYSHALNYLSTAAEAGDNADAQNLLGQMKELGLGNELSDLMTHKREEMRAPDLVAARFWYKRAYSKGHPGAMYNIGTLYETGNGVERDLERAVAFFAQAAKAGHHESKARLENLQSLGIILT